MSKRQHGATVKSKTRSKSGQPSKSAGSKAAAADVPPELTDAERAFIDATIARGEADYADANGELPAGATHELIEQPSGEQAVRRKRFSAA